MKVSEKAPPSATGQCSPHDKEWLFSVVVYWQGSFRFPSLISLGIRVIPGSGRVSEIPARYLPCIPGTDKNHYVVGKIKKPAEI
jgi:hypothetical protein